MRVPIEELIVRCLALTEEERQRPLGQLAAEWGVPVDRIVDAIDAWKFIDRVLAPFDAKLTSAYEATRTAGGMTIIGEVLREHVETLSDGRRVRVIDDIRLDAISLDAGESRGETK